MVNFFCWRSYLLMIACPKLNNRPTPKRNHAARVRIQNAILRHTEKMREGPIYVSTASYRY